VFVSKRLRVVPSVSCPGNLAVVGPELSPLHGRHLFEMTQTDDQGAVDISGSSIAYQNIMRDTAMKSTRVHQD